LKDKGLFFIFLIFNLKINHKLYGIVHRNQLLAHPRLTPSAFLYPAPKSTKDKNPQAMPRVDTGTCDGKGVSK
jgi:hypothetical protein